MAAVFQAILDGKISAGDTMTESGYTVGGLESFVFPTQARIIINAEMLLNAIDEMRMYTGSSNMAFDKRLQLALTLMHEALHWSTGAGEDAAYELEVRMLEQILKAVNGRLRQLSGDDHESCSINQCVDGLTEDELQTLKEDAEWLLEESRRNLREVQR